MRGTPRTRDGSALHDDQVAARLGAALGVLFATCALTGAHSHLQQHPIAWLPIPPRPAGLYRITQTVHVTAGFATIPVLLAKLWTVSPALTAWPPVRSARHALERVALVPLVGGGLFLLVSGVANVARWYPWGFFFPTAHYWTAWIAVGALVIHVGATWATSRAVLRRRSRLRPDLRSDLDRAAPDRRRFLGGVTAAAGLLALSTVGGSISWLSPVSFLAQRRAGSGPQGLPVNKTARQAHVQLTAVDPRWRLVVDGDVRRPLELTRDELLAMPARTADLPIACVEGWSASARWTGIPVRDLLTLAGAREGATIRVHSIQPAGRYSVSELNHLQAADRDTLLATHLAGEVLHLDHGYPLRLIGPNRPGVAQTKWVGRLEVV